MIDSKDLSEPELSEIIALCSRAFNEDFTPLTDLYRAAPHVVGYYNDVIVSHACWVTRWLQVGDSPTMRTGYVEGVATEEAFRNRGFASTVMNRIAEEIADFAWTVVMKRHYFPRVTIGKQLVNSAGSIGANVAEGTGCGSFADNRRFAKIARDFLFEAKHWLRRAFKETLV